MDDQFHKKMNLKHSSEDEEEQSMLDMQMAQLSVKIGNPELLECIPEESEINQKPTDYSSCIVIQTSPVTSSGSPEPLKSGSITNKSIEVSLSNIEFSFI